MKIDWTVLVLIAATIVGIIGVIIGSDVVWSIIIVWLLS